MAEPTHGPDAVAFDEVVRMASDLIAIDTSNHGQGRGQERPAAEYVAQALSDVGIVPQVLESAPGRANVVARIAGTDPAAPALLVHGHLDVVPADPTEWSRDPFGGEVVDGVVWGRGAVDMKGTLATTLSVVRSWARQGRAPTRDIVLAFTADEEDTAAYGSDFLVGQHAELFTGCTEGISESGAYTVHTTHQPDGRPVRLYPIAAGERGTAWLRLTAHGAAGHGSKPNRANAVGAVAAAVARIYQHHWPIRLTPTVEAALRGIAEAVGVPADLDAVDHLVARLASASFLVESTLRNSANPTMLEAGYKVNVIPSTAVAHVDGRVLPGGEQEFVDTMDELTGPDVDWEYLHRERPLAAPPDSSTFAAMSAALLAHDTHARVVPFSMSGGTDAKQFSRLGIVGYGFAPVQMPPELDFQSLFHGVDERVPVEGLRFGVGVLDTFLTEGAQQRVGPEPVMAGS
ncbi:MAG TPA: M20/M25/M40 family metallo-hydrolase [Jiangellaceae bacterium]|nr:M20/M25/M40 family metallo-hydrolase [Jiangellaceae bacterium]